MPLALSTQMFKQIILKTLEVPLNLPNRTAYRLGLYISWIIYLLKRDEASKNSKFICLFE